MERNTGDPLLLKLGSHNMLSLINCQVGDLLCLYAAQGGRVLAVKGTVLKIVYGPQPDSIRLSVWLSLKFREDSVIAVCDSLSGSIEFQSIH